jgi:hypothetical protein
MAASLHDRSPKIELERVQIKPYAQRMNLNAFKNANLALVIGLVAAIVIRGGLFFLSFGVLAPAFGSVYTAVDAPIALLLAGAAAAVASMRDGRRSARLAFGLGWVYLADNLIYAANIAVFYATSSEVVGDRWLGAVLALIQAPLAFLSAVVVRRTAWAVRKPIGRAS